MQRQRVVRLKTEAQVVEAVGQSTGRRREVAGGEKHPAVFPESPPDWVQPPDRSHRWMPAALPAGIGSAALN